MSRPKLKIAMITTCDLSYMNGTGVHVEAVAKALEKKGHIVHVFGTKNTKYSFKHFHKVSYATNVLMPGGYRGPIITSLQDVSVSRIIEKGNFDICHIHDPFVPVLPWELASTVKTKLVATFHTCWRDDSLYSNLKYALPIFSLFYRDHFKGTIYVSELSKRCWNPLTALSKNQKAIGNGVGNEFVAVEHKHIPEEKIKLLFVGRIEGRKGLLVLLKAVKKLSKKFPQLQLDVLGKGTELAETKEYVKNNKLEKYVRFRGELRGATKIPYLQQANIFCAPYKNEAFGLTVLEAAACGCTIVGFWEEGFKEFLNNYPYKNELLPQDKTVDSLTKALDFAISNKEVQEKTRTFGSDLGHNYRWSRIAEELETFYYSV